MEEEDVFSRLIALVGALLFAIGGFAVLYPLYRLMCRAGGVVLLCILLYSTGIYL